MKCAIYTAIGDRAKPLPVAKPIEPRQGWIGGDHRRDDLHRILPAIDSGTSGMTIRTSRKNRHAAGRRTVKLWIPKTPQYYPAVHDVLDRAPWGLDPTGYPSSTCCTSPTRCWWRLCVMLKIRGVADRRCLVHPVHESVAWITERERAVGILLSSAVMVMYLVDDDCENRGAPAWSGGGTRFRWSCSWAAVEQTVTCCCRPH
jgi:hypothetical protein